MLFNLRINKESHHEINRLPQEADKYVCALDRLGGMEGSDTATSFCICLGSTWLRCTRPIL